MHHKHKHGARAKDNRKDRLYQCWADMKQRCLNPNNQRYSRYGERGITVCSEWLDYIPFKNWALANGYKKILTLDRENNDGNYEPNNCRWATREIQTINRNKMKTNTSGYIGVSYSKIRNKWSASICFRGNRVHIGRFNTSLESAIARDTYIITNNLPHKLNGVM